MREPRTAIQRGPNGLERACDDRFYKWYAPLHGPTYWEKTHTGASVGRDYKGALWVAIPADLLWKRKDTA